jgi:LAS superfamily LD-carboxypeptidase LdcB
MPATKAPSSAPSGAPVGGLDIVAVRGIKVARQIAPKVEALLAAAVADGIPLGGWGYRSYERQIELRKKHCGPTHYDIYQKPSSQCTPPTATPGKSMHEKGLAIDITYNGETIKSRNSPAFQWLSRNAGKFGLFNLPSEPWHWSVNGK